MRTTPRGILAASSIRSAQIHPPRPKRRRQTIPLHLRHVRLQTRRAPLHLHALRRPVRAPQPPPNRIRNASLPAAISLHGSKHQPGHHPPSSSSILRHQPLFSIIGRVLPPQILDPPPRPPNLRSPPLALRHTLGHLRRQMGLLLRRRALVPCRHDPRPLAPAVPLRAQFHRRHAAEMGL